ncbi:helicase POLQ-like [Sinocyclocheilus rhinocerous]|uniref:helicase POLQ-like n=1 Tax=Sinocyclocheilus rhinocerous TaxID=307959 RepID=UPI0007B9A62A|nr:PREDICTED: helicase POLQ-like [Sinocyclocheilus rhinocerous]
MYTDNHMHEIVVKRNTSSSRKRSRDGMRSRITPAKKRSSFTSETCSTVEGHTHTRDMSENNGTELCCSDNEDLFEGYDSIVGDSSFLAKLEDVELQMRQCHDQQTPNACEDDLSDSVLAEDFRDSPPRALPSSQLEFQKAVTTPHKSPSSGAHNTSTPDLMNPRPAINHADLTANKPPPKARRSMKDHLKKVLIDNAATSSTVSKTVQQKEAVMTEEMSFAMQAMESISAEQDLGPFFGLPSKVKVLILRLKGIQDLYEWQKTCLSLDSVQQRRNLIYSLPTSGGKTLVAEILIFKELLCRKKDALLILPYISLVQEKVRGLSSFGIELDFMVEEYAGSKGRFPPVKRRNKNSLYVTTIEKGHSLVNSLIENDRLDNIGLVVVDELHMLGDGSRGAILEITLSKILYMSKSTQIIGMSATLGNVGDLQTFLNAENYTNDFRPVELKEYVKIKESIYEVNPREETCFSFSRLLDFKGSLLLFSVAFGSLVILRSPYVATEFLKRSQYKQMVGRAGRAGIDAMGESILILQDKDINMAKKLLSAPMEKCYSNLLHDGGRGLFSLVLSFIGLKITTTVEQVRDFMKGTLLSVQEAQVSPERSLWDLTVESIDTLKQKSLIEVSADVNNQSILQITRLGRATFKGSIDLSYCDLLYRDLSKGLEGLLLNSFLHLVYLVTPYDMVNQCKPDWMIYFRQFTNLSAAEQKMATAVGVPESFVARKAAGQSVRKSVDIVVVNRLYLALVLYSLLKETNLWNVSDRFQLTRGFVQTLLSSASAFGSSVLHFTEELEEFWAYKSLLSELTRRLTYCVQAELIPLMEVAGVMEHRAKQLYNAGYKTLAHLANADPQILVQTIENLFKRQANQIIASAKMLIKEKAEALQEEVDDLLMLPSDIPSL